MIGLQHLLITTVQSPADDTALNVCTVSMVGSDGQLLARMRNLSSEQLDAIAEIVFGEDEL